MVSPNSSSLGPSQLSDSLRLPACRGVALLGVVQVPRGPLAWAPALAGLWFSFDCLELPCPGHHQATGSGTGPGVLVTLPQVLVLQVLLISEQAQHAFFWC